MGDGIAHFGDILLTGDGIASLCFDVVVGVDVTVIDAAKDA